MPNENNTGMQIKIFMDEDEYKRYVENFIIKRKM